MDISKVVEISKALSNSKRVQILNWLKDPEKNFPPQPSLGHFDFGVCGTYIQKKAGLSQSVISTYLSNMERCGLLISTRDGKWTYFRRNEETIKSYSQAMS